MLPAPRFTLGLALVLPLASCATFDSMLAGLQPELTPAELSALAAEVDCDVVPLRHYATVDGALADGDCRDDRGRFVDYFGLRTNDEPAGQQYRNTRYTGFRLSSTEFDAYLKVKGKDVWRWREDDDSGGGIDAYMRLALGDGIYLVAVTSRRPDTGAYRLELERSAPPSR